MSKRSLRYHLGWHWKEGGSVGLDLESFFWGWIWSWIWASEAGPDSQSQGDQSPKAVFPCRWRQTHLNFILQHWELSSFCFLRKWAWDRGSLVISFWCGSSRLQVGFRNNSSRLQVGLSTIRLLDLKLQVGFLNNSSILQVGFSTLTMVCEVLSIPENLWGLKSFAWEFLQCKHLKGRFQGNLSIRAVGHTFCGLEDGKCSMRPLDKYNYFDCLGIVSLRSIYMRWIESCAVV